MAYGRYWVVRQAEKKAQAAATTSKAGGGPGSQQKAPGAAAGSTSQPQSKPAPAPAAAQTATMKPTETKGTQAAKPDPAKTAAAKQPTASSASAPAAVKPKETAPKDQKPSLGTATATAAAAAAAAAAAGKESAEKKDKDVTGAVSASLKSSPKPPADKKAKVEESSGMSLDALDALGDTLGVAEVEPEAPKPLPKDIVQENLTAEKYKGRVGEREDSLPPNYRFGGTNNDTPIPKAKEEDKTPMDDMAALDALSGDFVSPATSLNVHSAPAPSAATPKPQETPMDNTSALDALAGDFVCPDVRPKVHSAPAPTSEPCAAGKPANASRQESRGTTAALDALSDTLLPDELPPAPKPVPASAVVKDKMTDKHQPKLGEDENTIPEEYRFKDEKGKGGKDASKQVVKPKDQAQIDKEKGDALDALSMGFTSDSPPQKKAEDKKGVPSSTPAAAKPKTQSTDPSQPPKAKQQLAETTTDPKKTSKS